MKTIKLRARDLASKFGFMDGDIVANFCEENNLKAEIEGKDTHDVLISLVRKYLLPVVGEINVYEISSMHNPIRCEQQHIEELTYSDISVDVNLSQVIKCIKETKKADYL